MTADAFQMLTGLLGKLDHCSTPSGIQDTIVMVTEVAHLDDDFKVRVWVNSDSVGVEVKWVE